MSSGTPSTPTQAWVLVALGSNLGASTGLLEQAMEALKRWGPGPFRRSQLWRSTPVECPSGSPEFVNAAVAFPIPRRGSPEQWLVKAQALEREFGRRPKLVLNEARPLDLDLIAWGQEIRRTPALTLPHPRAHERRFVLQPLAELVPEFVLPGQRRTVVQLLADCPVDPNFRPA